MQTRQISIDTEYNMMVALGLELDTRGSYRVITALRLENTGMAESVESAIRMRANG